MERHSQQIIGKAVLITGSAGGIGRATTQLFSEAGWYVIGVDRHAFQVTQSSSMIHNFPENGLFIQADISHPQELHNIFEQAQTFLSSKGLPGLKALVNNAAIQIAKPVVETTIEDWNTVIANNLTSAFLGAKLAHPLLKAAGGGAIVNVSSVHAVQTSANIASYAASKGGLLALTRALAIEFAVDLIRVNAILPGAVDTAMLRASLGVRDLPGTNPEDNNVVDRLDNLARKTVIGRIGKPAEIAHAIFFLADDDQSSFMTGQALVVDGGATARLSTE
jgi:glucose 1-dehydrogenase